MININFKTLENTDLQIIHRTFLEAFSDYQMQVNLSFSDFQIMMKRNGFTPAISLGAFSKSNNEAVGFILNGLRQWNGKLTAYDTGTGVIPDYRRQGITSGLFVQVLNVLAQQNVEQYLLEVLKDNTAAFELYKNQGFLVSRSFSIYQLNNTNPLDSADNDIEIVFEINSEEWEILKSFWDFNPSWQNSINSINAVSENFAYAILRHGTKPIGYGIVDKATGNVPQFAVSQEYRRQGIATRILRVLMQNTKSQNLRFVNVDDASQITRDFFYHIGSEYITGQYEMILPLMKK